jgi:hypothetical protein
MKEPLVSTPRKHLYNLHAAARGMYSQLMNIESGVDGSFLTYLQELNAAIQEGHKLLGTERVAADNYVALMKEVHEAQLRQVQEFLNAHEEFLEDFEKDEAKEEEQELS